MHLSLCVVLSTLAVMATGKPIVKQADERKAKIENPRQLKIIQLIEETMKRFKNKKEVHTYLDLCALIKNQSAFGKIVMDANYWAEADSTLLKHFLSSLAVESFRKKFNKEMTQITTDAKVIQNISGLKLSSHDELKDRISEIGDRIERIQALNKDEGMILEMLNRVKDLIEINKETTGKNLSKQDQNHEIEDDELDKIKDILDKIDDLLDRIQDLINKICDYVEDIMSSFWDWLKEQPLPVVENIFCAIQWLMHNVEITDDGQIQIGDIVIDWDDLVDICCPFG